MQLPVLPPGTILQHLYLKERLRRIKPGYFLEVGCGRGYVSKVLLDLGWYGIGYDLNPKSLDYALSLNHTAVSTGRFRVKNQNFFNIEGSSSPKFDLIISCMVLEHFNDDEELAYFEQVKNLLTFNGRTILLVPSCPNYWGWEDEIAGHYRRYTRGYLKAILESSGYKIDELIGLTYPLSNWLYPISELLVKQSEGHMKYKSMQERTRLSGSRDVHFKTTFPSVMKFFLNEVTMYPFHILQKMNKHNPNCLVLYAEATKS